MKMVEYVENPINTSIIEAKTVDNRCLLLYIETLNQQNDDFLLQNKEKIQKKPIFGGFFSWLDQYI